MKITFISVGKTEEEYLKTGISLYEKRIVHYVSYDSIIIPSVKNAKNISFEELKEKEGVLILEKISTSDIVILLDEKGDEKTSVAFSKFIQQKMNVGTKNLVFVIGGAFGFSEAIYKRANTKIALSQLTFSHQMVRLFFVEQLYRCFTIIKNEKYHHI